MKAERILVAWKDTREARRAICDALPLLRLCQKAIVAEIDEDHKPEAAKRRVEDVASWLACHGVNATGAYGQGKFREWAFGGVTRDLLRQTSRSQLFAH